MDFKESMIDLQQFMDGLVKPGEDEGIVAFACKNTTGDESEYCVNLSGRFELASMAIARVLCGELPFEEEQNEVLYVMMRAAFGWFVKNASIEVFVHFLDKEILKDLNARFDELDEKLKDTDKHAETK